MTKQDVSDWIESNLPTDTEDGETVVKISHPQSVNSNCPVCGGRHPQIDEWHPVDGLAERYHEVMDTHLPEQAAEAAQAAIDEALNQGTGHERFFEKL